MSKEKAYAYLEKKGLTDHFIETEESTATVPMAAAVLGVTEGEIAKSLTFRNAEKEPILIVMAGDKRVDNKKFKATFHIKAKMLSAEEVAEEIGHEVGGVTPFGVNEGVKVYLDESLKTYDVVYPACGSEYAVAKFAVDELIDAVDGEGFVDVWK